MEPVWAMMNSATSKDLSSGKTASGGWDGGIGGNNSGGRLDAGTSMVALSQGQLPASLLATAPLMGPEDRSPLACHLGLS